VSGRFVVLEGGDASGKSTQAKLLASRLREAGVDVVETFEPGATPLGAGIRALVLDGTAPVAPVTEALLMAADRAQHVETVVRPALSRGEWVVSDRFVPSSLVYQGVARGLGVDRIAELSAWAAGGLEPDLVVVVDVSDEVASARREGETADRLEREGARFHAQVRESYRWLATERGWVVVDGGANRDAVAERVWAVVRERLAP
jgi:dTMP kinase